MTAALLWCAWQDAHTRSVSIPALVGVIATAAHAGPGVSPADVVGIVVIGWMWYTLWRHAMCGAADLLAPVALALVAGPFAGLLLTGGACTIVGVGARISSARGRAPLYPGFALASLLWDWIGGSVGRIAIGALAVALLGALPLGVAASEPADGVPRRSQPPPRIETFSVREQPVAQVILALAEQTGLSVVSDATATGTVSLVIHDMTPTDALTEIAAAADLILTDRHGVWWMSRVHVERRGPVWSLEARDALLGDVVVELSRATGLPVVVNLAGTPRLSITTSSTDPATLLERVAAAAGVLVESGPSGTSLVRDRASSILPHPAAPMAEESACEPALSQAAEGTWHIEGAGCTPIALVRAVADSGGLTLVSESLPTTPLEDFALAAPSSTRLMMAVLAALDLEGTVEDTVLLVARRGSDWLTRRFPSTASWTPQELSADNLAPIVRREIAGVTVTDLGQRLVVRGAAPAVQRAIEFARALDQDSPAARVVGPVLGDGAALAAALGRYEPTTTVLWESVGRRLVITGPEAAVERAAARASELDRGASQLSYRTVAITPEEVRTLLRELHPEVTVHAIAGRREMTLHGVEAEIARARELIAAHDIPDARLRYDVCIIQHYSSDASRRGVAATVSPSVPSVDAFAAPLSVAAAFDQLLSMRFDFVSALGYRAALSLSGELARQEARLVVDTSLRAREGTPARLQNATTFRYRDTVDDGSVVTQVTREIETGLEVELAATSAADGLIDLVVDLSLSRQGADLTGAGNPPPTSRRAVESSVRVRPGESVIIGGLLTQEAENGSSRIPLLGRIPVLGSLIGRSSNVVETSELVVYVTVAVEPTESSDERRTRQEEWLEARVEASR